MRLLIHICARQRKKGTGQEVNCLTNKNSFSDVICLTHIYQNRYTSILIDKVVYTGCVTGHISLMGNAQIFSFKSVFFLSMCKITVIVYWALSASRTHAQCSTLSEYIMCRHRWSTGTAVVLLMCCSSYARHAVTLLQRTKKPTSNLSGSSLPVTLFLMMMLMMTK